MKLQVVGQMIAFTERETLVSGTVNKYRAEFVFDDSWDGYTKTAVFRADSFGRVTSREVLLAGDACPVPHECLVAGALLRVGVYGISGDITTPTIYTQEPEDLPAQWGFYWSTDPKKALPFISLATSPYMTGDCCTEGGQIWRSAIDNNVWAPSAYPQGWEVVE